MTTSAAAPTCETPFEGAPQLCKVCRLAPTGTRRCARFVDEREGIDFEQLTTMVQSGQMGKILEVEDTEKGERVEIFAE